MRLALALVLVLSSAVLGQTVSRLELLKEDVPAASPLPFVPLGVTQEFIAGGLAQAMMEQILSYQSTARAKGDIVAMTTLERAGHFDMLAPRSTHWKTVEDRIRALVR